MRNNKEYKTTTPYNYLFPCTNFDARYCKIYKMDSEGNITLIESEPEMNMRFCKTDMTGLFLVVEDKVYSPGDLNGDGQILANDARLALRISAKLETATAQQTVSGDINKNGHIDASDARKILRYSAGLDKAPENRSEAKKFFLFSDTDYDGKLTASDARKALRIAAGLEKGHEFGFNSSGCGAWWGY